MERLDLTFFTDPGHGWVRVSHELIKEMGVGPRISQFSYEDDDHAYLEEDCDAPMFLAKAEARGYQIHLRARYEEESSIRDLKPRYRYRPWR